ncbi:hypothetical protein ACFL02_08165 [Planctomycetota bacterium]
MKNVLISDELYKSLEQFVVDPFDDTPEVVIGRVVDIANKARTKWSAFDADEAVEPPTKGKQQSKETLVAL